MLSLAKKIVFALLPTVLLLVTAEAVLRWTGAAERCPGYENNFLWTCDPLLYFKIHPGQVIEGRPLNRLGFRGNDFGPRRDGATRVLALGDSCTYGVISRDQSNGIDFIHEPYPERLQRLADERLGAGKVEVFNGGVPGYNSYQGLMLLRGKLRDLHPDIVTVRFGWNDLAMSKEQAIGNAFTESDSWLVRRGEDLLMRTALYPFARRLGMMLRARSGDGGDSAAVVASGGVWRPNLPVERFAHNLRRIVEVARDQGAEVWLLTSPDPLTNSEDFERYAASDARSSAQLMLAMNRIPSFERLAEIHAQYNAAVRQVASETGARLVDLETEFRGRPASALFSPGDVIHPNEDGHQLEAEILLREILQRAPLAPGTHHGSPRAGPAERAAGL